MIEVGGIDPGSQRTGVVVVRLTEVVLERQHWIPHADGVEIPFHETIRPKGKKLEVRLADLDDRLRWLLSSTKRDPERWCVEDPREAHHGKRKRATDVTLGAAFGVCVAAVVGATGPAVELVSSQAWIPKTRNRRGGKHPMKHNDARAWLKARWPALEPLSDDECFAAGMVIWHATGGAFSALC